MSELGIPMRDCREYVGTVRAHLRGAHPEAEDDVCGDASVPVRAHGSCVGRQCRIMDVRNAAGRIAVVHDKVDETVKTG